MYSATISYECFRCGTCVMLNEIAVTEEKALRLFGSCQSCREERFVDVPLSSLYRLSNDLGKMGREENQKLLCAPDESDEDTKWLQQLGIVG